MGSLGRLLVLAIAVTAVAAQETSELSPPLNVTEAIGNLQDFGCAPEDFTVPDLSNCECQLQNDGELNKLQCIVNSLGISSDSGYNQTAAEAFVDSLSSDTDWTSEQNETLSYCSSLMSPQLPTSQQGAYMLACWLNIATHECNKDRVGNASAAVVPEYGRSVGETVVYLGDGGCISDGLKDPRSDQAFFTCLQETRLNLTILGASSYYYKLYAMSNNFPTPSVKNVDDAREQHIKFDETVICMMRKLGEINKDGTVNYEQWSENIVHSDGPQWLKDAAQGVTDDCQGQGLRGGKEFLDCWFRAQPYVCASGNAHKIALEH